MTEEDLQKLLQSWKFAEATATAYTGRLLASGVEDPSMIASCDKPVLAAILAGDGEQTATRHHVHAAHMISRATAAGAASESESEVLKAVSGLREDFETRFNALTDKVDTLGMQVKRRLDYVTVEQVSTCSSGLWIDATNSLKGLYALKLDCLDPCCLSAEVRAASSTTKPVPDFQWPNPKKEEDKRNVIAVTDFMQKHHAPHGVVVIAVERVDWFRATIYNPETGHTVEIGSSRTQNRTDFIFILEEGWQLMQQSFSGPTCEALRELHEYLVFLYEGKVPNKLKSNIASYKRQAMLEYLAVNNLKTDSVRHIPVGLGDVNRNFVAHMDYETDDDHTVHLAGPSLADLVSIPENPPDNKPAVAARTHAARARSAAVSTPLGTATSPQVAPVPFVRQTRSMTAGGSAAMQSGASTANLPSSSASAGAAPSLFQVVLRKAAEETRAAVQARQRRQPAVGGDSAGGSGGAGLGPSSRQDPGGGGPNGGHQDPGGGGPTGGHQDPGDGGPASGHQEPGGSRPTGSHQDAGVGRPAGGHQDPGGGGALSGFGNRRDHDTGSHGEEVHPSAAASGRRLVAATSWQQARSTLQGNAGASFNTEGMMDAGVRQGEDGAFAPVILGALRSKEFCAAWGCEPDSDDEVVATTTWEDYATSWRGVAYWAQEGAADNAHSIDISKEAQA